LRLYTNGCDTENGKYYMYIRVVTTNQPDTKSTQQRELRTRTP